MKGSAIRPRPDQIADLTRGIRLPVPAIPEEHLLILAEGIYQVLEDLCREHLNTMTSGGEQEVTALVETRLISMIDNDENLLWRQLVQCVARGRESISFDGSHLEKRPDLTIFLSDRKMNFPLVVEAKILDPPSKRTVASYCRDGLARFISGEYAWGTQEAFMIGYVRDGSSINATLRPFLAKAIITSDDYLMKKLPVRVGSGLPDLAYTKHGRNFVYSNQSPPDSPGPISIWHLWLRTEPPRESRRVAGLSQAAIADSCSG